MNIKFIVIWVAIGTAILGSLWFAGQQNVSPATGEKQENPEQKSTLTYDNKPYDFGTISMAKGLVKKEFRLTNNTEISVTIKELYTSCMCTAANFVRADGTSVGPFGMQGMDSFAPKLSEVIKPGESRNIEVVYNPAAHGPAGVGPVDRFVYVVDENNGVAKLEILAVVTP